MFDVVHAEDSSSPDKTNTWLRSLGLPESVCRDIVNPGFEDPFDTYKVRARYRAELRMCALNSTVQYSKVKYSSVQYSAVQYSAVPYSTVQCSAVRVG